MRSLHAYLSLKILVRSRRCHSVFCATGRDVQRLARLAAKSPSCVIHASALRLRRACGCSVLHDLDSDATGMKKAASSTHHSDRKDLQEIRTASGHCHGRKLAEGARQPSLPRSNALSVSSESSTPNAVTTSRSQARHRLEERTCLRHGLPDSVAENSGRFARSQLLIRLPDGPRWRSAFRPCETPSRQLAFCSKLQAFA